MVVAAEVEQLAHEVRAAQAGGFDPDHGLFHRRRPRLPIRGVEDLVALHRESQDHLEDVVEVVRDAAGQAPGGFQFLRMEQLRLRVFALGHLALQIEARARWIRRGFRAAPGSIGRG